MQTDVLTKAIKNLSLMELRAYERDYCLKYTILQFEGDPDKDYECVLRTIIDALKKEYKKRKKENPAEVYLFEEKRKRIAEKLI